MKLSGNIKLINQAYSATASFKKREVVLTTEEQYPQTIMIEFTQDKCDLLDKFSVGENVEVSINLRGREWVNPQGETKYFNTIQGWKIEKLSEKKDTQDEMPIMNEETDDNPLPF